MEQSIQQLLNEKSSFYLFDIKVLKDRLSFLKSRLPDSISFCYAIKANPFLSGELQRDVDRFELCSPGEVSICSEAGISSDKMVVSGVTKDPQIVNQLMSFPFFQGIFTAESLSQYQLFSDLSAKYKKPVRILLRLTNNSQFGMNASDIEKIISERSSQPFLQLTGIQFFSGTQKTSLKKYKRELEQLDSFLIRLKEQYRFEAAELEYGPGFPVSYYPSDDLDEEDLLASFSNLILSMKSRAKLTLELGRSIAASCGKYYTRILDLKSNMGQNYALVDGGLHHITYYGHHMAMNTPPLSVIGKSDMEPKEPWTICGSLCSMNDILAKQIPLPSLETGDVLCFEKAGAYCMTEGASLFLSRNLPAIYLLNEEKQLFCIRPTFATSQLNTPHYERIINNETNT